MAATKCIENKHWEKYSRNELSVEELSSLMQHVHSCEICADIKEGIDAMVQPGLLKQKVEQINLETDRSLNAKKARMLPLFYWSAAAAIFIISTLFFLKWDETRQIQNQVAVSVPSVAADSAVKQRNDMGNEEQLQESKILADHSYVRKKNKPLVIKNPVEENKQQEIQTESIGQGSDASIAINQKNLSESETKANTQIAGDDVSQNDTKPATEDIRPTRALVAEKQSITKKQNSKSPYPSNLSNNNSFENSNDFRFNNSISNKEDSLIWVGAQQQFNRHNIDSAWRTISLLTEKKNSVYYEEALWLNAQIQIELYNKSLAKTELQKVIQIKGKHAKEAEKILKEME